MGFGMSMSPLENMMILAVPAFIIIIFAFVIVSFAVVTVRGVREWHSNNQSPRLTVQARVVAKRQEVSRRGSASRGAGHRISTWYYVTFEVESGDRMELSVAGGEYGLLAEGDRGRLTFQGTRYLGFQRM